MPLGTRCIHSPRKLHHAFPSRWVRLALVTAAAAGIGAYARSQQPSDTLNPTSFTPYCLVAKEPVSPSGSLFTLKPPKSNGANHRVYQEAWKTGVWSVMFKQPQLQIGRDYTPLPSVSDGTSEEDDSLRFFIRRDPFGEVSRYLHNLEIGASVDIRGPRIECEIPTDTQQVLFIAGGTGIAPALQAGHTLLGRQDLPHKPRIHILWANRRQDDCAGGISDRAEIAAPSSSWFSGFFKPSGAGRSHEKPSTNASQSLIVKELEALKSQYPGQVTVEYFVDEEGSFIRKQHITEFTRLSSTGHNMILVSGPEGFINYMAGPKLWAQGMELQGPLRGVIRELDLKDWSVWKL